MTGEPSSLRRHVLAGLVPATALVVAGLVLLPAHDAHLSTDGVSYLSIAQHWADGRLGAAVNAYWSPLLSWLLAPLLALGAHPVLAVKLLLLAAGAVLLVQVAALGRHLGAGPVAAAGAAAVAAPLVLFGAYARLTPDLLVALPLLGFASLLGRSDPTHTGGWTRRAFAAGVMGGCAYLAKLFALPAVVVATVVVLGTRAIRTGAWRAHAAAAGAVLTGLAVVALPWAATISIDEGRVTLGTAAQANIAVVQPGSYGSPVLYAGLFDPPHPDAVSVWENPAALPAPTMPGSTAPATTPSRIARLSGNVGDNVDLLTVFLLRWWPLAVVALAGLFTAVAGDDELRLPGALTTTSVVWLGGLCLLIVRGRYVWAPALLLVPLAAVAFREVGNRFGGRAATVAVTAATAASIWAAVPPLTTQAGAGERLEAIAQQLRDAGLEGADVAASGEWHESLLTCYRLGCRFLGVPGPVADTEKLRAALVEHDVDVLLVWGDDDARGLPLRVTATAEAGDYRVRVATRTDIGGRDR